MISSFLQQKGVCIPDPASVTISPEVPPENIFPGAQLLPGTRLYGAKTSVGPGSVLSLESAVTLRNTRIGANVTVGGGFLEGTTVLDGVKTCDGLHARPGTILEEKVGIGHTAGLKQTILMPYTQLGSLINFCDLLMSGGTGTENHSEVGSSYVHFNFTPHQDKATASLLGDVAHGVLLREKPIFLGGQGGLVGPRRIAFGTTVAAGSILRRDVTEPGMLVFGTPLPPGDRPYDTARYGRVDRIFENGLCYLANIRALHAWYEFARAPVLCRTPWGKNCCEGALECLEIIWKERMKRLDQLCEKIRADRSGQNENSGNAVCSRWAQLRSRFECLWETPCAPDADAASALRALHAAAVASSSDAPYLAALRTLSPEHCAAITNWLGSIGKDLSAGNGNA